MGILVVRVVSVEVQPREDGKVKLEVTTGGYVSSVSENADRRLLKETAVVVGETGFREEHRLCEGGHGFERGSFRWFRTLGP